MVSEQMFFASLLALFVPYGNAMPISGCKVLDLTHELSSKTPYYPVYKPFNLTHSFAGPIGDAEYAEYNFICSYEHMGTHVDAPSHFSRQGKRMHLVELETLIGEACVIDISNKVSLHRDYLLSIEDVQAWERENGKLDSDSIVLLYTGQQHLYWDMEAYFGTTNASDVSTFHFSSFSGDVAKWLIEERRVISVGVDCISLDGARGFPAHVQFLHYGKISGYENLNNLDKLPPRGATFFGPPLKIKEGSGSPVRAFALGWNGPNDPCRRDKMSMISGASAVKFSAISLISLISVLNI